MKRLAAGLLALAACADPDAPRLVAVEPPAARPGETVELTGENLCGTSAMVGEGGACEPLPAGYVSFGIDPQVDAVIEAWSDTRIAAVVPAAAGPGEVLIVVTVDGRSSNGISFTVE
jgi:uncharacterized protein (TIGR03437 family)